MLNKKKEHPLEKTKLHPRNKHRGRYDFKQLIVCCPELAQFVKLNDYDDESVDFFNPAAVKALNKALLKYFYDVDNWDIPNNYLCPAIPGRADYIHHIADLITNNFDINDGKIPTGNKIICLDIGVGANCVYPIIGNKEYGWSFIATDIDTTAIKAASKIAASNSSLKGKIEFRLQPNPKEIFSGIIQKDELIDFSICNPPFHSSAAEAQKASIRKLRNIKDKKITKPILNFGGQNNELCYEGGEKKFIQNMIYQSKQFSNSCLWFSTLVSKQSSMKNAFESLKKVGASEVKTKTMGQGNKTSRILVWTFLNPEQQKKWMKIRWE